MQLFGLMPMEWVIFFNDWEDALLQRVCAMLQRIWGLVFAPWPRLGLQRAIMPIDSHPNLVLQLVRALEQQRVAALFQSTNSEPLVEGAPNGVEQAADDGYTFPVVD